MSEFASHSGRTANDLAIQNHTHTNTFGARYGHQIANAFSVMTAPEFSQGTGVGRVLQFDRQARGFLQWIFDVDAIPIQVRRENEPVGSEIYTTGQRNADSFVRDFRMGIPKLGDALDEILKKS